MQSAGREKIENRDHVSGWVGICVEIERNGPGRDQIVPVGVFIDRVDVEGIPCWIYAPKNKKQNNGVSASVRH